MTTMEGALPRRRGRPSSGAERAIVTAALELIQHEGLARVTTKEVARRAGVSEASVFYHFGDKLGLLRAVVLAGLEPLERFDLTSVGGASGAHLDVTFAEIGAAFEAFFARALPVIEAIQGDPGLREAFCARLVERDLGPHRGVDYLSGLLGAVTRTEQATAGGRTDDPGDQRALAMLLIGASFLRAWTAHLGPELASRLPGSDAVGQAFARILAVGPKSTD